MRNLIQNTFHSLPALLLILTSGCSTINMQPEIDAVNQIHHERILPNEGFYSWSVGQWALFRTSQSSGEDIFQLFGGRPEDGFRRVSITGKSGESFWLEQHIVWPDSEQHIAALVSTASADDQQGYNIHRLKFTENGGEVVELEQQQFDSNSADDPLDEVHYLINLLIQSRRTGRTRNVTVPAGTFENTNAVPFSMSLRFGQIAGNVLYSRAVPAIPIVKLQSSHITSRWFYDLSTWELADFGQTGASSHFQITTE